MEYTIIAFCLYMGLSITVNLGNGETPFEKIESRLETLENKLTKIDVLLDGFDMLCDKLNHMKRNGNGDPRGAQDKEGIPEVDWSHDSVAAEEQQRGSLKMISIESEGIKNNAINVTVVFTTSDNECNAEWFLSRNYEEVTRYQGQINNDIADNGRVKFTCKLTLNDIGSLHWMSMVVTSSVNNAFLDLNISALRETGKQMFNGIEYEILDYVPEITLPGDILEKDGFETTIKVTENVVEAIDRGSYRPDLSMIFLNTSTNPATFNDIWGYTSSSGVRNPTLLVSTKNGSDDEIVIQLDKDAAVNGGILTLRLGQNVSGYLYRFTYGVEIKVINEDVGGIIPPNTFGLRKQRNDVQLYSGPYTSLFCMAFGNPVPNLSIYKKKKDGTRKKVIESYGHSYDDFVIKVLEIGPMMDTKPEGEYICHASTGDITLEDVLILRPFSVVEIDEEKTRLARNTTKETVVTCKTTGNPAPTIRMHVNNEYGEHLLDSQSAQYRHKINNKKTVSKVKLVISPPDENIRSIYCVATQDVPQVSEVLQKTKNIKIR